MNIPQPGNVASVLVDGVMWSARPRNGDPGWAADDRWYSTSVFEVFLDSATSVIFYSPTGREIKPEG